MKYYALEKKENKAELYVFGSITAHPWREKDKDAYGLVKELSELEADEIDVHINSNGGAVSEGLAIYNVLKNNKAKVTTYCDGFACSAASVIFMAGDERVMNSASLLMIHNAWTYGEGDAAELRKQADDLETITQASVNAYMQKVNITEDALKDMMNKETWLSADDAIKYGFATKTYEEKRDGASQSAQINIRDKILNHQTASLEKQHQTMNVEKLAEIVAEKTYKKLKEEKQEQPNSWEAFFS